MGEQISTTQTAASDRPAHGSPCPRCGNGVLYLIGRGQGGDYLACFNCDTRGTVPAGGDWARSVDATTATPTGFQVTHEQAAAQDAVVDPEQAADHVRRGAASAAEQAAADVAERDQRIAELQRQLDDAHANQQQQHQGGEQ